MPVRIAERLGYRKSHHQIAEALAATMAVMAIEINSERAVSLIQSATDPPFPVGCMAGCFSCVPIFRETIGTARSRKFK
jgi:hypothetical protein